MQRRSSRPRRAGGTSRSKMSRGCRKRSGGTRWHGSRTVTAASGAFGPDPPVLAELRRVTAPGGMIALISPESPEWFEAEGWRRITAPPLQAPHHPAWLDEFFGPLDPPHELVTMRVDA